jgi:hypothetical protein
MPVTQSIPFSAIAFSDNPVLCELQSDDYLASAGVKAVNALKILGAVADGATILLQWNTVQVNLTAKNAPDDSAEQFPAGDGSAAHVLAIAEILQDNFLISQDFDVVATGQQINFTAKQPGAGQMMKELATGPLQVIRVTLGEDKGQKLFFAHHIQVWVRPFVSTEFVQAWAYNIELDYPVTGKTTTDIGPEVLHNHLEPDLPVLGVMDISACINSIANYYIRYGQYYGQPPIVRRLKQSPVRRVVLGGLSLLAATERNIISELCPDINDETKNRFMRQGSKAILVTQEQPEWLYFINFKDQVRNVSLEVTITNTDNSTFTFSLFDGYAFSAFAKYQMPAGYNQLQIGTRQPADKLAVYYTLRLKDTSTGYITAAYTYVVDYTFHEWSRYFVYLNAYGAFQTLATTGKAELGTARKKEDARMDKPAAVIAAEGEYQEYNITYQENGTVNIGYDRATIRSTKLLRDFASSTHKFLYEDGRLIPIGISSTDFKDAPDGTDVYAGSFDFYYLMEESRYTETPGLPDDDVYELMRSASSPVPPLVPGQPDGGSGGAGNLTGIIDMGEDYDTNLIDLGE